ncbi:immunoglobulin-like domain-containing protein [Aliidiomarina indica]|uniref:immunoglobulin-like domain-containing protein n=1 Tax=Aliidiomarina indica TaxID=2749147 RepID=UPI00188DF040|nr:immunoglobulin-like domain-containing protein [Aliidiomarina indica]
MKYTESSIWRNLVGILVVLALTGCFGSSSSPEEPDETPTFTVTAVAESGGSIDPATRTVEQGSTTTFTVTADDGFAIDSVTGCNGSLDGETYTTGQITAACTVTATFEDIEPPQITLLGDNPMELMQGDPFVDPGAEAIDNVDGEVEVEVEGEVNTQVADTYILTYTATDSAGNSASEERTVIVMETSPETTLTMNRFGEGSFEVSVDGDTGIMVCEESRSCSFTVRTGSEVTVSAAPAADWDFHSWGECPGSDDVHCSFTAQGSSVVSATFLQDMDPEMADDVVVLSEAQVDAIMNYDSANLVITFQVGADVSNFAVGDVIVSSGGSTTTADDIAADSEQIFFVRRVTNIIEVPGAPTQVRTIRVTLDDVFVDGFTHVSLTNRAEVVDPNSLPQGVELVAADDDEMTFSVNHIIYDADEDETTTYDQVALTGSITIHSLTPELTVKWPLEEMRMLTHADITASLMLRIGDQVGEQELMGLVPEITLPMAPYFIGPVPVVPELTIMYGARMDTPLMLMPMVMSHSDYTLGFHYVRGEGYESIAGYGLSGDWMLEEWPQEAVHADAGLGIRVTHRIAGEDGPYFEGLGYSGARIVERPAETGCAWDLDAYTGLWGRAGGNTDLFGRSLDVDYQIVDTQFGLELGRPMCDGVPVDPMPEPPVPDTIALEFEGSSRAMVSWSVSHPEYVARYFVYESGEIVSRGLSSTQFVHPNRVAGEEYCYQVSSVNYDGVHSARSAEVCATAPMPDVQPPSAPTNLTIEASSTTALSLSWDASSDDHGVAGYLVFWHVPDRQPVIIADVESTEYVSLSLTAETEYCYSIVAYDAAGNLSGASEVSCETTLPADEANWIIYLACVDREYLLQNYIDLDVDYSTSVSVSGTGRDYPGTELAYTLFGTYNADNQVLSADITWVFEGSSTQRRDRFSADLSTGDTGNIVADQIEQTGCDLWIRFVRSDMPQPNVDVSSDSSGGILFNHH